jgi:hypothetical protein
MIRRDRAVEVLHNSGTSDVPDWSVGSGYLIGGRLVLTAAHNVGPGECLVRRHDDSNQVSEHAAVIRKRGDDIKLDLAVLELSGDDAPQVRPPVKYAAISQQRAGLVKDCTGLGFPAYMEDELRSQPGTGKPLRDIEQLNGNIPAISGALANLLTFQVTSRPHVPPSGTPWRGISGTVVFAPDNIVGERVIGVVTEHHMEEGSSALALVPVDAIRTSGVLPTQEQREWCALLGVTDLPDLNQPWLPARLRPPSPPSGAVPRPRLAAMTLSALRDGPAPLVALIGGPGFGKSVLARQVAAQVDAQAGLAGAGGEVWCPGGVVWLDVGRARDLASVLAQRLGDLTGLPVSGQSAEKLAADLGTVLAARGCLLVLDDMWPPRAGQDDVDVVSTVLSRIDAVPRLVTTRSAGLLAGVPGVRRVDIAEMEPDEAAAVLAGALPAPVTGDAMARLSEFAPLLGGWPLLLSLAAGYLGRSAGDGVPLEEALAYLTGRYADKGVTAFDGRGALDPHNAGDREKAVAVAVEASLELLPAGSRARYCELAVFQPGQPVPVDIIAGLWAPDLGQYDTDDLLTDLADLSLLGLDLKSRQVRLHDVLQAYLLPADAGQRAALHQRLLGKWGGPLDQQDAYRIRAYAYHLDMAGDSSQLYALISPAWRDQVLSVTGSLADVQADAQRAAGHAATRGDLPQELRCRLIAIALAERARAVPGPLLPAFARLGQLPRALGYATLLPPSDRDLALADIAAALAGKDPGQALEVAELIGDPMLKPRAISDTAITAARTDPHQALDMASRIGGGPFQAYALTGIAVALAHTDPAQALTIADRLDSVNDKTQVLAAVASALATSHPDQAQALADRVSPGRAKDKILAVVADTLASTDPDRALTAARAIGDDAARVQALAAIAAALAWTGGGRAVADEAGEASERIGDCEVKAQALARIAAASAGADPARASTLVTQAWAAADNIGSAAVKAAVLTRIAETLASTDPGDAVAAAKRIGAAPDKARVLGHIAANLARTDPGRFAEVAGQALDAARSIADPYIKGVTLADFAAALAGTAPDQALAIAGQIEHTGAREQALTAIATTLASTDPDRALLAARQIGTSQEKAQALAVVAAAVADTDPGRFPELASQAAAVPEPADLPPYEAAVLTAFASLLASTDADLALAAADRLHAAESRDEGHAEIASALAETNPDAATAIASAIDSPVIKAEVLADIAITVASTNPQLALDLADHGDYWTRGTALAGIAAALAKTDLPLALATARRIDTVSDKAKALAGIAAALAGTDPAQASTLAGDAVEAAGELDIDDAAAKANVLAEIAVVLAQADSGRASSLAGQSFATARQIANSSQKTRIIVNMARELASHAPLAGAVADAASQLDTGDPALTAMTLAGFAAALATAAPARAQELAVKALDAADGIDDAGSKARVLAGLAGAILPMAPGCPSPLASRILDSADHLETDDPRLKAGMLARIAGNLAMTDPGLALATAERTDDPEYKAPALTEIAAVLAGIEPARARDVLDQAIAAVQDDTGSSAQALNDTAAGLADTAPGLLLAAALQRETRPRTYALNDIAAQLADRAPELALVAADQIGDLGSRVQALANVAGVQAGQVHGLQEGDMPPAGLLGELITRLRGIDPSTSREAWWRLAQLAVTLASEAAERHDLVQAVLAADW